PEDFVEIVEMPLHFHPHVQAVPALGHGESWMPLIDFQLPASWTVVHLAQVRETADRPYRRTPGVRHGGHTLDLQNLVSDVILECCRYAFVLPEPRIAHSHFQQRARSKAARKVAGGSLPAVPLFQVPVGIQIGVVEKPVVESVPSVEKCFVAELMIYADHHL